MVLDFLEAQKYKSKLAKTMKITQTNASQF